MNYYVNLLIVECCYFLPNLIFFGIDYRLNERFTDRPTCRVDHLLPEEGGAIKLPSDFKINSLLELRQKLHTSKQEASTSTNCLKHNDPLKVYIYIFFEYNYNSIAIMASVKSQYM